MTGQELALLESLGMASGSALLKGKKKKKEKKAQTDITKEEMGRVESHRAFCESAAAIEATDQVEAAEGRTLEGPRVKVILLTEGPGNRRDKNYYGPEAVRSMPALFEGAVMQVDHPSYSEERDIPEGRVNKTVGYYKNLRVESIDGKLACVGEVHFDRSPEGVAAYEKAKTAVHYQTEFPGSNKEYVGLSVNAAGESEPRQMTVEGETSEWSYVLRFVEARSCDMVTIPARGGKIVALVESITGARMKNEEVRMKTLKRLEAAQTALKLAESEKDPDLRLKKTSEARREVEALIKDIKEAAARQAKEAEGKEKKEDESESEAEAESEGKDMQCAEDEDGEKGDDDASDDDGDGGSHTITHKVVSKGKAAVAAAGKEADRLEANRLAVESLVGKLNLSGCITKEHLDELARKPFREAKKEVERMKTLSEATASRILKQIGEDMPGVIRARESGSGSGDDQSKKAENNAEFDVCSI